MHIGTSSGRTEGTLYIARPQIAATVEPTADSLRPKAALGVLLMILLSVIGTALARIAKIILPLFLLPSDFGLFALATFFTGFLSLFADLGFSTTLITRHERFKS